MLKLYRSIFKFPLTTGRKIFRINNYVVKIYKNLDEAKYEYYVLTHIINVNPINFQVPKVFKITRIPNGAFIVMEYIRGRSFESYIMEYILARNPKVLLISYLLGKAIKELHMLNLGELRSIPLASSESKFKLEIVYRVRELYTLGILNRKLAEDLLNVVKRIKIDDRILYNATLHGEFYFTHI